MMPPCLRFHGGGGIAWGGINYKFSRFLYFFSTPLFGVPPRRKQSKHSRHAIPSAGLVSRLIFLSNLAITPIWWRHDGSKALPEPKELRDFHGKCQGVHVDVRVVFISVQGYTSGCAEALSKLGELRVVMLDGSHLMSVLSGAISFGDLLKKVVRKACDEGVPYVPPSAL